jgi:hypothetical protein
MAEPRRLRFATLDSVVREVERLRDKGYTKAGRWDLSQVCEHLADWMTYPLDGFPPLPWSARIFLAAARAVQGKKLLRQIIETQAIPADQPTLPESVHPAGGDEQASVARLIAAIERLTEHRGTLHPSPLFGSLSRQELITLQLAHCLHHLNYLIPKQAADDE